MGGLPVGSYEFWVKAWDPVSGFSPWSAPETFEVACATVMAPSPFFPAGGNLQENGYWATQYVFNNPASAANPTATWGQFQIKPSSAEFDDAQGVVSQWVEYDFPGRNGVVFEQIPGLAEFLTDSTYDWRCREYSPCGGIGDWSGSAWGDVTGTDSTTLSTLRSLSFFLGGDGIGNEPGEHLFHSGTFRVCEGTTPALNIDFRGVPWIRIYIHHTVTQEVVFFEWIQLTEHDNLRMPKLKSGTSEVWTQSYHLQCCVSEWSDRALAGFSVRQAATGENSSAENSARDLRGMGHFAFRAQEGMDWYQLYVTCGDRVLLNQWFNLENRDPGGQRLNRLVSSSNPGSDPQWWGP